MKTLISCGELFSAMDEEVRQNQIILVEGARIECVGSLADIAAARQIGSAGLDARSVANKLGARFVDLSRAFVTPGLIEGHAHIGMDPALSMNTMMLSGGYGEIAVRAIKNAQADLMAGFTTVRDEGCFAYIDVDVRNLIDAGEISGPRLVVSGMALSSTGGHADFHLRPGVGGVAFPEAHIAYIVDGADAARAAARKTIKYGADVVKLMATGGVLSGDASMGSPDLAFDEMRAACEIAHAHGKIVSAHAHGPQGIKDAIRAGVDSLEHGTLIDEEGCQLMHERGVTFIPTLVAHRHSVEKGERGEIPPLWYRKACMADEQAAWGLTRLHELGCAIGFGTDAGTSGNRHGGQAEEFSLMMERGALTAAEVLLAATHVNAQMLGLAERIGTIEPGKTADIAAFAGNPLSDIRAMERCIFVMRDGEVYRYDAEPAMAAAMRPL